MIFWVLIVLNTLVMAALMSWLFKIYLRLHNAGIVDVGWAGGLALLGLLDALLGRGYGPRRFLIGVMALIWGLRLAWHLWTDRIVGKPEDPRYATLRQKWNDPEGKRFFLFFQSQALLDVVLALPFLLAAINPFPSLSGYEVIAIPIWMAALLGESAADSQLKHFKANPENKGKTCREGLWNYSRHPNYFFEWLIWVAYFVFALGSPYGVWTIIGPLLMLYFLLKVTGIPATEAQALKTRGDDYRDYQRTTSMFIPWFRKSA